MSTIKRNGNLGQSFEQVLSQLLLKFSSSIQKNELPLEFVFSGDEGETTAGGGREKKRGRTTNRFVLLNVQHHITSQWWRLQSQRLRQTDRQINTKTNAKIKTMSKTDRGRGKQNKEKADRLPRYFEFSTFQIVPLQNHHILRRETTWVGGGWEARGETVGGSTEEKRNRWLMPLMLFGV